MVFASPNPTCNAVGHVEKLSGQVEADETFIGGKARNMHIGKRIKKIKGTGGMGKMAVMGLLERHGQVRTRVIGDRLRGTLHKAGKSFVEPGSEVFTDAWAPYTGLDGEYVHQVIDHAEKYVDGQIHTNGIENFWSLLKRSINGTYVSVMPFHLFRYLDEQSFRYNTRKGRPVDRFTETAKSVFGRRLTYAELTSAE